MNNIIEQIVYIGKYLADVFSFAYILIYYEAIASTIFTVNMTQIDCEREFSRV